MSEIINYLQHRVEEAKSDLQGAVERMQQAVSDQEMFRNELQGYERALAAEMRRQGMPAASPAVQDELTLTDDDAKADLVVNKAEFARQFIRDRADTGVTPNDIYKGFQDAKIEINKAYVYSLIQRLQASKPPAIKSKRGKWYPILESEQPVNGTAEKALP